MSKPRVLIVDDDPDVILMLSLLFEKGGVEVEATELPEVACQMVASSLMSGSEINLVVTDIRMPLVSGNEFARQIKDIGYPGTVVAFTAAATGDGKRVSNQSGIDRYFDKNTINQSLVDALILEYCKKS